MRKRDGFTLIELLVVISISSILFGIGYASYRSYTQRQILMSAGRDIVSGLKTAQNKAAAGEKPASCTDAQALDGYRFLLASDGSGGYYYQIYAYCSGNVISFPQFDLPESVTYAPAPGAVFFKSLTQGTGRIVNNGTEDSWVETGLTVTLTQTGTNSIITIVVSPTREITENF